MTLRSVWGVNAKAGQPASELFAGVVAGLLVVRSGLTTHVAPTRTPESALKTCAQVAAPAEKGTASKASAVKRMRNNFMISPRDGKTKNRDSRSSRLRAALPTRVDDRSVGDRHRIVRKCDPIGRRRRLTDRRHDRRRQRRRLARLASARGRAHSLRRR